MLNVLQYHQKSAFLTEVLINNRFYKTVYCFLQVKVPKLVFVYCLENLIFKDDNNLELVFI